MSADNGIYVLKSGRQYRVAELTAAERLYWDQEENDVSNRLQPKMILEMFGDKSKYTYDAGKALDIATQMFRRLPICEYGIVVLDARMSWGKILSKALESQNLK